MTTVMFAKNVKDLAEVMLKDTTYQESYKGVNNGRTH